MKEQSHIPGCTSFNVERYSQTIKWLAIHFHFDHDALIVRSALGPLAGCRADK
jgi:hypothetical protein